MTRPNERDLDILIDLASQIHFRNHLYVRKDRESGFVLAHRGCQPKLSDLKELIERSLFSVQGLASAQESRILDLALCLIQERLEEKVRKSWIPWLRNRERYQELIRLLGQIQGYRQHLHFQTSDPTTLCESSARLMFFREFRRHVLSPWLRWLPWRPKAATNRELAALRLLSGVFWSKRLYGGEPGLMRYFQCMAAMFRGDHILVEEEQDAQIFQGLKHCGAREGNVSPYGHAPSCCPHDIRGPLIRQLSFGRVELLEDCEEGLIYGQAGPSHPQDDFSECPRHQFTWIQMEHRPDGPGLWNIWGKRWIDQPCNRWLQRHRGPFGMGRDLSRPYVVRNPLPSGETVGTKWSA